MVKTIFETSNSNYSPSYSKKDEPLDNTLPDTHRKSFLTLPKKLQGKQVRENTIERKVFKQDSIPIKVSIAAPVVTIPNFQPSINDETKVRNFTNSISTQKLVEYPEAKNCPFLLNDNTLIMNLLRMKKYERWMKQGK